MQGQQKNGMASGCQGIPENFQFWGQSDLFYKNWDWGWGDASVTKSTAVLAENQVPVPALTWFNCPRLHFTRDLILSSGLFSTKHAYDAHTYIAHTHICR